MLFLPTNNGMVLQSNLHKYSNAIPISTNFNVIIAYSNAKSIK